MNPESLHGTLLAASDLWSELFSTLLILLFIAVPAIIRTITEVQNRQKERQRLGGQKIEDVSKHKAGPQKLGPAEKGTQRPRGPLSEWDRRQEQIRERMNRLKEQAGSRIRTYQQPRPQAPSESRIKDVHEEVLPVAQALPEQPERVAKPPVYRPNKPDVTSLPEKMRQYMQAGQSTVTKQPAYKPKPQPKTKRAAVQKPQPVGVSPAIERIVRSSNPLRAGIILKEILDKPKGMRFGSDI